MTGMWLLNIEDVIVYRIRNKAILRSKYFRADQAYFFKNDDDLATVVPCDTSMFTMLIFIVQWLWPVLVMLLSGITKAVFT